MINIKQIRYRKDNLGYVLYTKKEAIAIDPGNVEKILSFIKKHKLTLKMVTNTHSHFDHTIGNKAILKKVNAQFKTCKELVQDSYILLDGEKIEIIPTPGHTMDSICFKTDNFIVTGDTIFIANVGNASDLEIFWGSIQKLLALPDNLIIYPGHDYTERSIKRAMNLEPDNQNIIKFWNNYTSSLIYSTIGDEKKINPYIRSNTPVIKEYLKFKGMDTKDDFACFKSFMTLF